MPQAERLLLADVGDVDHVRDAVHDGQQVLLVARLQQVLQLEADIEMVFDGALAAAGHDDDVLDPRMERLLHAVLDDRLVDDGQHLFGLRLGGGEESRPEPGGGEHGFSDFGGHPTTVWCAPQARFASSELYFRFSCAIYRYLGKLHQWHTLLQNPASAPKTPPVSTPARSIASIPRRMNPTSPTEELLYIDPVECIDCGACVPVCPVSAIFALDDLPEKWADFTPRNAAYYGR